MGANLDASSQKMMVFIMTSITCVAVLFLMILHYRTTPYIQHELQRYQQKVEKVLLEQKQKQKQLEENEQQHQHHHHHHHHYNHHHDQQQQLLQQKTTTAASCRDCCLSFCSVSFSFSFFDDKFVLGSLISLLLMTLTTIVLTFPIVMQQSDVVQVVQQLSSSSSSINDTSSSSSLSTIAAEEKLLLTSSINFCEMDYQHSPYIAEPANVMSSLAAYVPLALIGLFGPPSKQQQQHYHSFLGRFRFLYIAFLNIGIGSMALHGTLTAHAQAGDELPMLWFIASASYCSLSIVLRYIFYQYPNSIPTNQQHNHHRNHNTHVVCLKWTMSSFAVLATAVYVHGRDNFIVFSILFSIYVLIVIFSMMFILLGIDWTKPLIENIVVIFKQQQQQQQQSQQQQQQQSQQQQQQQQSQQRQQLLVVQQQSQQQLPQLLLPQQQPQQPPPPPQQQQQQTEEEEEENDDDERMIIIVATYIALQLIHDVAIIFIRIVVCTALIGIWSWTTEMLFCKDIMDIDTTTTTTTSTPTTILTTTTIPPITIGFVMINKIMMDQMNQFIWNRVLHTVWHFTTAFVAWLLIQGLFCCHGIQQGWGVPKPKWYFVPYCEFDTSLTEWSHLIF